MCRFVDAITNARKCLMIKLINWLAQVLALLNLDNWPFDNLMNYLDTDLYTKFDTFKGQFGNHLPSLSRIRFQLIHHTSKPEECRPGSTSAKWKVVSLRPKAKSRSSFILKTITRKTSTSGASYVDLQPKFRWVTSGRWWSIELFPKWLTPWLTRTLEQSKNRPF